MKQRIYMCGRSRFGFLRFSHPPSSEALLMYSQVFYDQLLVFPPSLVDIGAHWIVMAGSQPPVVILVS